MILPGLAQSLHISWAGSWCTICKLCKQKQFRGLCLYVSQKCAKPTFCVCILVYLFIIIANVYFNVQISAKYTRRLCKNLSSFYFECFLGTNGKVEVWILVRLLNMFLLYGLYDNIPLYDVSTICRSWGESIKAAKYKINDKRCRQIPIPRLLVVVAQLSCDPVSF